MALSNPYVDPFIRQLQEQANPPRLNPDPEAASPPSLPLPATSASVDEPLSSLVHDALRDGHFRAPPALPLFESGLLQPLHSRCLSSSQRLHHVLLTRCDLLSHLSALRGFFLSAEGVLLDDFIAVFRSSHLSTPLVNDRLTEALSALPLSSPCRRFLVGRLRASHGEAAASFSSISSSFSSSSVSLLLTLTFHLDVPYPLDAIITGDHLRKYNQLLHFILHLRVSLRVLARLSTLSSRQSSASGHPLAHRFHLLRAAVHHCIRVLHDYVLTHATLTAWPTLLSAMSSSPSSTSLERLGSHHSAYLERILHLCLLTPNLSAAFAALQKMVGGVGAVEGLGRLILHDALARTIDDDWDDNDQADDNDRNEADNSWSYEDDDDERSVKEARRKRRQHWRLSLSEVEQQRLRLRYQQRQDELQAECWRRLEELRVAHDRNLRFFLLVLDQISTNGVHPHRQQRNLPHTSDPITHPVEPLRC